MLLIDVVITLSGSFPDEHTRRTDQLVLCTANGKKRLCCVKLLSGITVAGVGVLLMALPNWGLSLRVYGLAGFDAAISVATGMILAGMIIRIPTQDRMLGPLWDYLPACFLSMWNTLDNRLMSMFGMHFNSYQIVPWIYIDIASLLAFLGSRIDYRRQISGR